MVVHRSVQNIFLVALLGAMSAALRADLPARAQQQAAKISTLIVGWDVSDAASLDPGHAFELTNELVDHAAYDTLVTISGGNVGHIQADLATSWQIVGDNTVFTFKLRRGVRFASGNPLTAADVVFSYRRLQYLNDLPATLSRPMKTITALDPYTVQITLRAPDSAFLAALTTPTFSVLDSRLVISKGATDTPDAARTDTARTYLDRTSAGSGPYVLAEWTRNTRVVLRRSPLYWGPRPYFQEVILDGVSDPETQQLQLQKGQADMAFNLTDDQVAGLKRVPNVRVAESLTLDYFFLAMNVSPAISRPLSNPLVRQAIRYAIDYHGINQLTDGASVQLASVIPIGYVGNSATENAALRIKTDVHRARALLAQAGYPKGFSVPLTSVTGISVDGVAFDPLAAKIINDLKAAGITVTPKAEQVGVALSDFRSGKSALVLWIWTPDYPDAYDNLSYFGPGGTGARRVHYLQDGNLTNLIARSVATTSAATRGAIYRQVEAQLLKTGPYAVLMQPEYPVGLRADLRGFSYSPIWRVDLASLSD
jgi:peptide/nickel transport system substrate-binding protein